MTWDNSVPDVKMNFKEKNFFADTEEEKVSIMANLDRLSQHLTMEKLAELNLGLSAATENQLEIFQQFVSLTSFSSLSCLSLLLMS